MNSGWRSAIKAPPPQFICHAKHFIMVGNDHAKKLAEIKARAKEQKKSDEICNGIDYTSSAFPRRTQ